MLMRNIIFLFVLIECVGVICAAKKVVFSVCCLIYISVITY